MIIFECLTQCNLLHYKNTFQWSILKPESQLLLTEAMLNKVDVGKSH